MKHNAMFFHNSGISFLQKVACRLKNLQKIGSFNLKQNSYFDDKAQLHINHSMSDSSYEVLAKKLNITQQLYVNANKTEQTKQPKNLYNPCKLQYSLSQS